MTMLRKAQHGAIFARKAQAFVFVVRNLTDESTKQAHSLDPAPSLGSNSALFLRPDFVLMTTPQLFSPEFDGIDDLTLAEVDARLKEHQQLLQVLLQSPGAELSYLPPKDQSSAGGDLLLKKDAELLFQQAITCTEQQDVHQAATLFCRAAYMGHLQSQVQLGHCYLKGAGVPKSAVFAYSWFILAALQQDTTAEQACTVLTKHLTLLDQQQAQQLAAERFEKITLKNNK